MHVTIRELRSSTKKLMQAVDRGEEVIITSHGKEKAKIEAIKNEEDKTDIMDEVFGMWKSNKKVKDVREFIRTQRKGRKLC